MTKKIEVFASEALPGELESFPDIKRGWGTTKETTGGIPPMKWFNAIQKRTDEAINAIAEGSISGYTFKDGATLDSHKDFIYDDVSKSWYFWIGESGKVIPPNSNASEVIESDGGIWSDANLDGLWVNVGDASLRSDLGVIIKRYPDYYSMIDDSSLKIGDTISSGRGVWEVLNAPVSGVSDLRMISPPSLYDFGAVGGDAEKDTEAFKFALSLRIPIIIPNTSLSKAFVVKGIIDLPAVSMMIGDCDLVQKLRYGNEFFVQEQPYITFYDENSRFAGGRGAENRVTIQWSNLVFISSAGTNPKEAETRGMAIGPIDDTSQSAIGGRMNNVVFQGFRRAFHNDWSYFFNINNVDILNCYDGLIFNDFNASSISNVYATEVANVIDTGNDSAQSTISNVGVNIGPWTEVAVKINGGVTLGGYNYFESFGSVFKPNSTCIAYQSTYFSNRPMEISNVLFDAKCDYHLTIDSITESTGTIPEVWQLNGNISRCRFYRAPGKLKVGFGIHKTRGGEPTYPSMTISNFDISTCMLISASDLRAQTDSPYKSVACKSYMNAINYEPQSIAGTTFVDLKIGELTENNTNVVNSTVVGEGTKWKVPATGLYQFSMNITLNNNTGNTIRSVELRAILDGKDLTSTATSVIKNETSNPTYSTVTLSGVFYASRGLLLHAQGRRGVYVTKYILSVAKISDGE